MSDIKKLNGFFLLNKPTEISSFWAISRARNTLSETLGIPFKQIKVGHAGTLDPLAQGLLLCAVGKSTKMLSHLLLSDKKYIAELHLGEFSETDDAEGKKSVPDYKQNKINSIPELSEIKKVLDLFVGKIQQTPPQFSALKIEGKRACDRVREITEEGGRNKNGSEFTHNDILEIMKTKNREIEIFDIKFLDYNYPKLKIEVHCGTGTYIRSLARDIGEKLQEGAYISFLERTDVGVFSVKNAVHHNDITEKNILQFEASAFGESFSSLYLQDENIIKRFEQGQKIAFRDLDFANKENGKTQKKYEENNSHIQHVLLWAENKQLLGLGELKHDILIPRKIIS
ncbi:TPA: tRNA pseudouridine(55) synthase TruB [Candidatus Gracilibacteria bacterium]|nr:tRNA pseudouridine(55) synthase TruB [Candidatus Peregrinibacteria bacterium]HIQ56652.1 tRNA pseudouridine(55) synthase TruB [Candidatus Gracilibacteria bacterium]HIQ57656.1 tRNA pseudouridine(55) synthase TruB [Candidatus Gracilibacteria bacterium]